MALWPLEGKNSVASEVGNAVVLTPDLCTIYTPDRGDGDCVMQHDTSQRPGTFDQEERDVDPRVQFQT